MSSINTLTNAKQTEDCSKQLIALCSDGNLDEVKRLSEAINLEELKDHVKRKCFYFACGYGYLDLVKWLDENFKIIKRFPRTDGISWNNFPDIEEEDSTFCTFYLHGFCAYNFFKIACENGHLEVAKWLLENKAINPNIYSIKHRIYLASLFIYTCRWGKLGVAKWLREEKFTEFYDGIPEALHEALHEALYEACGSWFCKNRHLPLNSEDVPEKSRVEMVKWLASCDSSISKSTSIKCLQNACEYGHLNVVKYLVEKFDLNVEDIKNNKNHAFVRACVMKHHEVARWLEGRFNVIDGSLKNNRYLFSCVKYDGNVEFKKWLVVKAKLSPENIIDLFGI